MTPEEAKKRADELRDVGDRDAVALRTLADALREAQAAVVQMREDAAKIADGVLDGPLPAGAFAIAVRISKAIRSLPAPAARTYDDGVRAALNAVRGVSVEGFLGSPDGVAALMQDRCEKAVAERMPYSPAPAVAPVAAPKPGPVRGPKRCPGCDVQEGLPCHGHCPDLRERVAAPKPEAAVPMFQPKPRPTPFDAEAALVAQADQLRHAIGNGRQYVTCADLLLALDAGVIAGRGGGR